MEKRAAREFDHPDPAIRLHDRQERDGFGADNRRDGHPAQRVGQRILHRVERQRLHAAGHPSARVRPVHHRRRRDSDYTRLASRIRESGREVLGFGEKKTPKPFIKSCDKFIYVEILGQSAPAPAPVSAPAQTAAAVPAAKAATPKKTAKKHQGRNAPETDMPEAAVAEHVAAEAAPAEPAAAEKKVAPAPDTAQPQPIIRPIDDDFKTLLANTIEDAADDSGWAFLGIVGGVLTKKMPDFDPRNYGYKKLSLLVKSLSKIVEIEERPSENKELKLVYVRNRIR